MSRLNIVLPESREDSDYYLNNLWMFHSIGELSELPIRDRLDWGLTPWERSHALDVPLVVARIGEAGGRVVLIGRKFFRMGKREGRRMYRGLTLLTVPTLKDAIPFRLMHIFGRGDRFHVLEEALALAAVMEMKEPLWEDLLPDRSNLSELLCECMPLNKGRIEILLNFAKSLGQSGIKSLYKLAKKADEAVSLDQIDRANLRIRKEKIRGIFERISKLNQDLDEGNARSTIPHSSFSWALFGDDSLGRSQSLGERSSESEVSGRSLSLEHVIPPELYEVEPVRIAALIKWYRAYMRYLYDSTSID